MADQTTGKPALEEIIDRPFTKPEDEQEGIGPTLGEDVSVAHEREEDARHGAQDIQDDEED
jgi:hypothetical protein